MKAPQQTGPTPSTLNKELVCLVVHFSYMLQAVSTCISNELLRLYVLSYILLHIACCLLKILQKENEAK